MSALCTGLYRGRTHLEERRVSPLCTGLYRGRTHLEERRFPLAALLVGRRHAARIRRRTDPGGVADAAVRRHAHGRLSGRQGPLHGDGAVRRRTRRTPRTDRNADRARRGDTELLLLLLYLLLMVEQHRSAGHGDGAGERSDGLSTGPHNGITGDTETADDPMHPNNEQNVFEEMTS